MTLKNFHSEARIEVTHNHVRKYFGLTNDSDFLLLSISEFISIEPQKFYDDGACRFFLEYFRKSYNESPEVLIEAFNLNWNELGLAFESLKTVNLTSAEDSKMWRINDWDRAVLISQTLLARYVTILDSTYNHFIYPIAHYQRVKRGKSLEKLDLYQRMEEIKLLQGDFILPGISTTIRNGISHGHVTFNADEVMFESRGQKVTESYTSFIRRCDDVLDLTNGLALAYLLFLNEKKEHLSTNGYPLRLLVQELRLMVNNRRWVVEACLPGTFGSSNDSQLWVFAKHKDADLNSIQYNCCLTASELLKLGATEKRFFISLKSFSGGPGWCSILTEHLKELLDEKEPTGKPIDNIYFKQSKFNPHWLRWFRIRQNLFLEYYNASKLARKFSHQKYWFHVHHTHRLGWRKRVSVDVIIRADVTKSAFRSNLGSMLRIAKKNANRKLGIFSLLRWMPTTYLEVSCFDRPYRPSRMQSFGLGGGRLATIKRSHERGGQIVDLWESTIEVVKGVRIAWNNNSKFASDEAQL